MRSVRRVPAVLLVLPCVRDSWQEHCWSLLLSVVMISECHRGPSSTHSSLLRIPNAITRHTSFLPQMITHALKHPDEGDP
ncbi:hypothetical protein BJX68DRAFT_238809 [Aspergillus pseudodeflectus]|uniref:Secreted protein n=1 Tax=Aspergillus pseudodeflectus TaxID=176178 RepID=A0ABR4K7J8_9EURO